MQRLLFLKSLAGDDCCSSGNVLEIKTATSIKSNLKYQLKIDQLTKRYGQNISLKLSQTEKFVLFIYFSI